MRQKSGITYTRLFSPDALAHQGRKGAALTIPLLPPRARERGAEKLPHTPKRRLFQEVQRQVCASPGAPFDATSRDEPVRRHLTGTDRRGLLAESEIQDGSRGKIC